MRTECSVITYIIDCHLSSKLKVKSVTDLYVQSLLQNMLMTNHRYVRINFASIRDRRGVYQRGRGQGEGEGEGGNSKKYFRVQRPPSPCLVPLRKLH